MPTMRVSHLGLLGVVALGACSRPPQPVTDLHPPATNAVVKSLPGWYLRPPRDNNYLFGAATALSRDVQLAINKAQADGRSVIAQELEVKYGALNKRFVEEVGREGAQLLDQYTQVYKAVVNTTLYGSRPRQQELRSENGLYRATVLMELPVGEMSKRLLEQLRAQEQLYTRYRAGEAFKELEAEVERYEAWKRQQR